MRSLGVRPICESPDVKLSLIAHQLQAKDVVHCISFITAGLQALGQQEIIFTLRVSEEIAEQATEADVPTPESLMQLLQMVVQYAVKGQVVRAGDRTILDLDKGSGLFGRHDFRAVLYINGSDDFPRNSLHALLLTRGEAVWLERLGPVRVMAKLGEANRFFPSTIWIDVDRPSVFDADDLDKSAVVQMGLRLRSVGTPRGAWVYLQISDEGKPWEAADEGGPVVGADGPDHRVGGEGSQKRCLLEYGEDFREFMTDPEKESLSGEDPQVGFFTSPEQDALHVMTYQVGKAPNDPSLTAISSPNRKQKEDVVTVLGNYVFLVQCGDNPCGANLLEDGFVVMVPSMADLIAAVKAGKPFDVPAMNDSMLPFRLQPKKGALDKVLPLGATLKDVRLMSPDEEITAALGEEGPGKLAEFVGLAAKLADEFFTGAALDDELPRGVKDVLNLAIVSVTMRVTEEKPEVSLGVQIRNDEGDEGEGEGEDEDETVKETTMQLLRGFSQCLGGLEQLKAEKDTTFEFQLGFVLKLRGGEAEAEGGEEAAAAAADGEQKKEGEEEEEGVDEEGAAKKKEEEEEEEEEEGKGATADEAAEVKKDDEAIGGEAAEEEEQKKSVDEKNGAEEKEEEEEGIDKEKASADVGCEATADADVATQG